MIAWKYIDTSTATIAAIRDYNAMRVIINSTPEEIKAVYEKMTAPRSPNLSGMPSARNPQSGQDKIVAHIDKLDVLRERYSQAIEYMSWFEPAWSSLTDTEQLILREFYTGDNQKSGATYRMISKLGYSERQVERMRSNSLRHLRVLLFG